MFFYYWEEDDELEEGFIKYGVNGLAYFSVKNNDDDKDNDDKSIDDIDVDCGQDYMIEPDGFDFYFDGDTDDSIGLFMKDSGIGTGFLIDDQHVLSNAHVLENDPDEFLAGMEDSSYSHSRTIEDTYFYEEDYEPQSDLAIAELNMPIDEDVFSFETDTEVADPVLLQGYGISSMDKEVEELYYQYRTEGYVDQQENYFGSTVEEGEDWLNYTNLCGSDIDSSAGGHSGSPVINEDGEVVAVHGYSGLMGPDITKDVIDWVTDVV